MTQTGLTFHEKNKSQRCDMAIRTLFQTGTKRIFGSASSNSSASVLEGFSKLQIHDYQGQCFSQCGL